MLSVASGAGEVVAWICLVLGVAVLSTGVVTGLRMSSAGGAAVSKSAADQAELALRRASTKLDEANRGLESATRRLQVAQDAEMSGLGSFERADVGGEMREAARAAADSTLVASTLTESASSTLKELSGIVGALPERTRFAGLLILVGTLLISVATIQFGGTSLF